MFRQQMTRLFAINSRSRHWLVWIALLVPFAAAAFASIPHVTNAKYGDYTYAKDGLTLTNGNNSYTVIATDSSSRKDTNVIAANLPGSVSFIYDSNGNLTSDGLRGFDYDDENRLTGITVANTWKTLLIYDGLGRRRGRYEYLWFNGAWAWNLQVEYVYDGNVVVQERWGGDEPWINYTRGLDVSGTWQGSGGVGGLLAWSQKISGAYQSHYYHSDGNGNVTAMLNTNQVVSARYLYDPYGNILASSGGMADVNVYRFSSQEFHEKSGLYAYAMRFYEPRLGRWLNGDPLREGGGINLHRFCGGDPINRVDLWGLESEEMLALTDKPRYVDAWYNSLAKTWMVRVQTSKDFLNNNSTWLIAGTLGTAIDLGSGFVLIPSQIGNLGTAEGTFSVTPSLEGALYVAADASLVAGITSGALIPRALVKAQLPKAAESGAFSRLAQPGGLTVSENAGGHLLARHVGLTEADLAARLSSQRGISAASTFATRAEAEAAVAGAFDANAANVSAWTASGANGRLVLNAPFSGGSVLQRGAAAATPGTGVRVVLQGNGSGGYNILTGFPTP